MSNGAVRSEKSFDLTPEIELAATKAAHRHDVSPAVVPEDQLLGFLINNRNNSVEAVDVYFDDGRVHALQLSDLFKSLQLKNDANVLEFAAGFGRISRHLIKVCSNINLVACDIHIDACEFLNEKIGVRSIKSNTMPEELDLINNYDMIFAISFFSHLPEKNFGRWLAALYGGLAPGGYLMFTTHGETAVANNPDFWNEMPEGSVKGHRFWPYSDQLDLDQAEYGTSLALPEFVMAMLRQYVPTAKLLRLSKGKWFQIQDEWLIQKPLP